VFDLSRFLGDTCENMLGTKSYEKLQKVLTDKTSKYVGYPRTEKWQIFPDSMSQHIVKNVRNSIINMEDPKIPQETKDSIEITVDFREKEPKVEINLKRNETLAAERNTIYQNNIQSGTKPMAKNVLYMFIDSISRVNWRLKLPKTWKWLEQYYKNEETSFESFQFLKYHGVARYTGLNAVPAMFGVYNIYLDSGKYFLDNYINAGYVTGQSVGYCGREIFDIDVDIFSKMKWNTYDHEMASLLCDPNFTPESGSFSMTQGVNSSRRRCLYNKLTTEYVLEYGKKFWKSYQNEAKFFRMIIEDGHEGTGEVITSVDDLLANFYESFKENLNDTLVFIQTDHGFSLPGPYSVFLFEDFLHDIVLPSYFLLVPKQIDNYAQIKANLLHNELALVTPFDGYKAVNGIIPKVNQTNIFNAQIGMNEGCERFYDSRYFSIADYFCRCQKSYHR